MTRTGDSSQDRRTQLEAFAREGGHNGQYRKQWPDQKDTTRDSGEGRKIQCPGQETVARTEGHN